MVFLEDVLNQIEELKNGLSAEIVLQEAEWHWQAANLPHQFPGDNDSITTFPITDKPRITEPDIKKREAARVQLQRIYDSSEWYSGRYEAGMALSIDEKELGKKAAEWIIRLKDYLKMDMSNQYFDDEDYFFHARSNSVRDLKYLFRNLPTKGLRSLAGDVLGYSETRIFVNEHKAGAILAGLGAASGLYVLHQYLNR